MPAMHEIMLLQRSQLDQSVRVLTAAFADYSLWQVLFPSESERNRVMPVLWRGVVTYCQRYGMVATTPDIAGIAAWIKPGYAHLTLWKHIRTEFLLPRAVMLMSMAPRLHFLRVMSETDRLHRQLMPQPHWYLWALGIDPSSQGRGIGDRLLISGLTQAQEAGIPCYLETQTEENVAFYRKRGFEVLHEIRFPGLDLRQWFMCSPAV